MLNAVTLIGRIMERGTSPDADYVLLVDEVSGYTPRTMQVRVRSAKTRAALAELKQGEMVRAYGFVVSRKVHGRWETNVECNFVASAERPLTHRGHWEDGHPDGKGEVGTPR